MSNPVFARLQATAQRLIAKFGQEGAVKRISPPDPVLGGDGTETSYPATLVPMTYEAKYIDGSTIKAGDMQIYVAATGLPIIPSVGDLVTANGVDYHVVSNDPNLFDGVTPVVHIVQGRQ